MPTNRFNYSDDFVLNNGKVGINSASPQEKLDVVGVTKADNLSVVGVSSLTGYEGFLRANHNIAENTSLEGGQGTTGSLSGEIVVGTGVTVTGVTTATSGQGYIDSLKVYNTFTPPVGGTEERPTKAKPGQLYYNQDFKTIEFFDGNVWRQVDNTTQRGRGVFGGGDPSPSGYSTIDYINLSSTGNALNFGILTVGRTFVASCSSSTRGLFSGGQPVTNVIDYITIASEGNAIDFGDTTLARERMVGCSSQTRGLFAGGYVPGGSAYNIIDYVTIATIGNALDFGDLTATQINMGACASPTRGIFAGGDAKVMSAVTISSTGNAVKFGDLSAITRGGGGFSNATRGIFGGGYFSIRVNAIEFITIASFGNSTDFGDLTLARGIQGTACNSVRGVWAGGATPSLQNVIDYININTLGDAIDFGDLTQARYRLGGCSDSHGGLGGF